MNKVKQFFNFGKIRKIQKTLKKNLIKFNQRSLSLMQMTH